MMSLTFSSEESMLLLAITPCTWITRRVVTMLVVLTQFSAIRSTPITELSAKNAPINSGMVFDSSASGLRQSSSAFIRKPRPASGPSPRASAINNQYNSNSRKSCQNRPTNALNRTTQCGRRCATILSSELTSFSMYPMPVVIHCYAKDIWRDHNPRAKRGDCDLATHS